MPVATRAHLQAPATAAIVVIRAAQAATATKVPRAVLVVNKLLRAVRQPIITMAAKVEKPANREVKAVKQRQTATV